ncbi:MAG: hypothetical protein BWZ07_01210 [Alphaproteobacteria bacterium ADurb.BinA280]|nr:MAG: hypothetical protein BWZ07_01210 [Alphaproteobacteria bacterium ADurb.BinA280]
MAHGREKGDDARRMRPDTRAFLVHFGHPYRILAGIKVVEDGAVMVQLIAEHKDEMADGCTHGWSQAGVTDNLECRARRAANVAARLGKRRALPG